MKFHHNPLDTPISLVLDVQIGNDAGEYLPIKGIIDTGADMTVIPEYYAGLLKLDVEGVYGVTTATGARSGYARYSISIKIGSAVFNNIKLVAVPNEYVES